MQKKIAAVVGVTMLGAAFVVLNQTYDFTGSGIKGQLAPGGMNYAMPTGAPATTALAGCGMTNGQCGGTCGTPGWMCTFDSLAKSCICRDTGVKKFTLSVDIDTIATDESGKKVKGLGIVTGSGINCTNDEDEGKNYGNCSTTVEEGMIVNLAAHPATYPDMELDKWQAPGTSCDNSSLPSCTFTASEDIKVTALFKPKGLKIFTVTVGLNTGVTDATGKKITGFGAVQGSGISCTNKAGEILSEGTCSVTLQEGATVTLNAVPATDKEFDIWDAATSGGKIPEACKGSKLTTCTFTLTSDVDFIAWFRAKGKATLALNVFPTMKGNSIQYTIGSQKKTCGDAKCMELVEQGTSITLAPAPGPNQKFNFWMTPSLGRCPCAENQSSCSFVMDAKDDDTRCTAMFTDLAPGETIPGMPPAAPPGGTPTTPPAMAPMQPAMP